MPAGHSGKERHCAHGLYQATEWGAKKSPKKGSCFGKGKYNKRCTTGGLLASLLLTLVIVPVAYDLFDEL